MIMTLDSYFENTQINGGKTMYSKSMKNKDKPEFDFNNNSNCFDFNISVDGNFCGGSTCLSAGSDESYCAEILDDAGFRNKDFMRESMKLVRKFLALKNKKQYEEDTVVYTSKITLFNFLEDEEVDFDWELKLTYCP